VRGEPKGRPAGGYLTAAEVCRRYGISRTWLESLAMRDLITVKRGGARRWYQQHSLDQQMPHRVPQE
jgi:hypothetical protein